MLFNSYEFIFLFLPLVLVVFYLVGSQLHHRIAIAWLVGASLFFYSWWNPAYLILMLVSILFNYSVGMLLTNGTHKVGLKIILIMGIAVNLGILGYFKYVNFFVENINTLTGNTFHLETIILPLAISFFTFQQITYLVDTYQGEAKEYNFLHYCLFVTLFPQLIAGPIVHHKEMLPQFAKKTIYGFSHEKIAIGLSIFFIGLFKKVVIADSIALYSTPMFDAAQQGIPISFLEAWGGAMAYTFQLYFDFSGYSDMAVGLAYLFGIRLAINFFSPYKANSIIDFWRHWHITLSRFLRDYLYIPLGGNRKGKVRRYSNLMVTMLLGGLWHGAGWTFVAWGMLHGFYLIINNLWRALSKVMMRNANNDNKGWGKYISRLITFFAIVVSWVLFRAESFPAAVEVFKGMAGVNGIILPESYLYYLNHFFYLGDYLNSVGWRFEDNVPYFGGIGQLLFLLILLVTVWFLPNTIEFFGKRAPVIDSTSVRDPSKFDSLFRWHPNPLTAIIATVFFIIAVFKMDSTSEFLYFQF